MEFGIGTNYDKTLIVAKLSFIQRKHIGLCRQFPVKDKILNKQWQYWIEFTGHGYLF